MKDMYIIVQSLRDSYQDLVKNLPAWLGSGVLEWRGEEGMPSAMEREDLWMSLGVDSVVVDLVVKMGLW